MATTAIVYQHLKNYTQMLNKIDVGTNYKMGTCCECGEPVKMFLYNDDRGMKEDNYICHKCLHPRLEKENYKRQLKTLGWENHN